MRFIKATSLLVAAYALNGAAKAHDLCPAGPFETSVRAIAAAIAAQPLRPRRWDATAEFASPPPQLTDGVYWNSAGGFMSPYGRSLSYDAKRYVLVGVFGAWPSGSSHLPPGDAEELSNQVVHRVGHATYTTTVTRPTPEQARRYACLANRLITSSPQERSASPAQSPANPEPTPASAGDVHSETCSSKGASTDGFDPDGHEGRFELLSRGSVVDYDTRLSCDTRAALLYRMNQLTEDWLDESTARAKGTWRAPRIADLATDAAGALYLLPDLGSLHHSFIDILKITPSGDMTRLPAPTASLWEPYANAFAVDGQGHAWVPVPGSNPPKAWIYDIGPEGDLDHVGAGRPRGVPEPTQIDGHVDAIAVDVNRRYRYALSGSQILEIAPNGTTTPFVNVSSWTRTGWFSHAPLHIAAASDGTLFVSDPNGNCILEVTREKVVTVLAGTPGKAGAADGPAITARFNSPKGLALDQKGILYVADSGNQTIRRIARDGQVTTFAGKPGKRGTVDGQGEAVRLDRPTSIAVDSTGTLYVTNGEDNLIRKISPAGVVSTLNARQFVDAP